MLVDEIVLLNVIILASRRIVTDRLTEVNTNAKGFVQKSGIGAPR